MNKKLEKCVLKIQDFRDNKSDILLLLSILEFLIRWLPLLLLLLLLLPPLPLLLLLLFFKLASSLIFLNNWMGSPVVVGLRVEMRLCGLASPRLDPPTPPPPLSMKLALESALLLPESKPLCPANPDKLFRRLDNDNVPPPLLLVLFLPPLLLLLLLPQLLIRWFSCVVASAIGGLFLSWLRFRSMLVRLNSELPPAARVLGDSIGWSFLYESFNYKKLLLKN